MITVRMSDDRLKLLDAMVAEGLFPSRAAALKAGIDRIVAEEQQRSIDRAIVDGYTRVPPTAQEDAYARAAGIRSVEEEPW